MRPRHSTLRARRFDCLHSAAPGRKLGRLFLRGTVVIAITTRVRLTCCNGGPPENLWLNGGHTWFFCLWDKLSHCGGKKRFCGHRELFFSVPVDKPHIRSTQVYTPSISDNLTATRSMAKKGRSARRHAKAVKATKTNDTDRCQPCAHQLQPEAEPAFGTEGFRGVLLAK